MLLAMIFPLCTNMLYSAAETARVRTALLFFAFHATRIAWQYGYERMPVSRPYRTHGEADLPSATSAAKKGIIQMLERDEMMDRSPNLLETQVMTIRLTANMN